MSQETLTQKADAAQSTETVQLNEMETLVRRSQKNWKALKVARQDWDFKAQRKQTDTLSGDLQQLQEVWEALQSPLQTELQCQQALVESEAYISAVEAALKAAQIPFQGSFPVYELPPFELSFAVAEGQAHLKLGRQRERTTAMNPTVLAAWVAKRYRRVTDKKFDAERFLKELLEAYKLANQLAYREEQVNWGNGVALDLIYTLLTLRQEGRKEYPRSLFIYELARLKEHFALVYRNYQFELGFARNQGKAYILVDSQGRESRISSLTVHQLEG